jgi:hypothetical protein
MINLYGFHSPTYYIITIGLLGLLCSYKAWHGFTNIDKTNSTILLSQSYLIFAIFCFGYVSYLYLYQLNLFPILHQDSHLLIWNIWSIVCFLIAGLHGLINKRIINKPWHSWASLQLLIAGGILGFGEILMIFFPLK